MSSPSSESPQNNVTTPAWAVEVYYDGACPLCRREMGMLRRLDRRGLIRFTDIAAPDFDPARLGSSNEQLMGEIHGRLPDGTWIKGVEVFRRLYGAVGFRWVIAVSRWPGIRQALDLGYRLFARHRLRMTGRCTDECRLPASASH